jgi:large subunit ribosomal protein L6
MSRVGKHPVAVPQGVQVTIADNTISVKGKLGTISCDFPDVVTVTHSDNKILVAPVNESIFARSMWGTLQRNIKNAVKGVSDGFTYNMELVGVGYRASVQGKNLVLQLGFSHDVTYPLPAEVTAKCEKPTTIALTGPSKQQLGQIVAEIAAKRPPEPYKGKGVIKENQFVLRKEGKKK